MFVLFSDWVPKLIYRLCVVNLLVRIMSNIEKPCSDRIDAKV